MIYLRLSEADYGSVVEIQEKWDVRMVVQALHRLTFLSDYEDAYLELNK